MKCKYSYCKYGGEVKKEDAIKIGNSYFHKQCNHEKIIKQEIEEYYIKNMPTTALQLLRKVIKQIIHDNKYEADYLFFVLKYIKNNNKTLNNPFGLINYCNDGKLVDLYNKQIINKQYNNIKENIKIEEINKTEFRYKPIDKKWTDIW